MIPIDTGGQAPTESYSTWIGAGTKKYQQEKYK